jgi:hypothetical protein
MAEEKPPAPQSVIALYRPLSRACMITSVTFFSVMGAPICTAVPACALLSLLISPEEKVAP